MENAKTAAKGAIARNVSQGGSCGSAAELIRMEDLPHLNVYQFPLPVTASQHEKESFSEKLDLHNPSMNGETFTMFVSVPYCRTKCYGCPFFKALLPEKGAELAIANYHGTILEQIKYYADTGRFGGARLGAVYMGGGTASLLSATQVGSITKLLSSSFDTESAEITLEGNPKEFTSEYLEEVKGHGVNRVSVGYQSKRSRLLEEKIGSPHTATEGETALKAAIRAGFSSVNVDMLYGVPGQTLDELASDIEYVIAARPGKVSLNSFIVYQHTMSDHNIRTGVFERPASEDVKHDWYLQAREMFFRGGYGESRAGSFTMPGHEERYSQLAYYESKESIPIGAGAYGFVNGYIFKATSDPGRFIENISNGLFTSPDFQSSKADEEIMMARHTMMGLLRGELRKAEFEDRFGVAPQEAYPRHFEEMSARGLIECNSESIRLTDSGIRWRGSIMHAFADGILGKALRR